jgi:5'-nucleotidase
MDAILADLTTRWLEIYNEEFGASLTTDDVTNWGYEGVVPAEHLDAFHAIIARPGMYLDLPVIDGAQEAVSYLGALPDVELFILTAAKTKVYTGMEKMLWLEKHFPSFDRKHFMPVYYKEMVKGDVLIDDSPKNIHKYRRAWPDALIYAIEYPYNNDSRTKREAKVMPSYKNTRKAWEKIVTDIRFRLVDFSAAVFG